MTRLKLIGTLEDRVSHLIDRFKGHEKEGIFEKKNVNRFEGLTNTKRGRARVNDGKIKGINYQAWMRANTVLRKEEAARQYYNRPLSIADNVIATGSALNIFLGYSNPIVSVPYGCFMTWYCGRTSAENYIPNNTKLDKVAKYVATIGSVATPVIYGLTLWLSDGKQIGLNDFAYGFIQLSLGATKFFVDYKRRMNEHEIKKNADSIIMQGK